MKKQTAVEFLIDEMQKRLPEFYAHFMMDMDSVYEQAKEMEKDQMKKLFEKHYDETGYISMTLEDAEQYYTETYGGNI
jgi:glutamate synthase domain-containing protein 3